MYYIPDAKIAKPQTCMKYMMAVNLANDRFLHR